MLVKNISSVNLIKQQRAMNNVTAKPMKAVLSCDGQEQRAIVLSVTDDVLTFCGLGDEGSPIYYSLTYSLSYIVTVFVSVNSCFDLSTRFALFALSLFVSLFSYELTFSHISIQQHRATIFRGN